MKEYKIDEQLWEKSRRLIKAQRKKEELFKKIEA